MHVTREGKVGYRWYLWAFHAPECVADPRHEVPEEHFGEDGKGILVVDRYAAYQAMDAVADGRIVLAFCWAHVRRDFLRVGKGSPRHADWASEWVDPHRHPLPPQTRALRRLGSTGNSRDIRGPAARLAHVGTRG